jgi:membrane-anchored protein YejM (alkaline phosphatase superfamily)
METQIVIFLALVSIVFIINTVLIWLTYKALSGLTSKVTEGVSQFVISTKTNEWMPALKSASEQAIAVTEAAKLKLAQCQPAVEKAHNSYRAALNKVDSTLETVADQITTNAKKARDVVAGPAVSFLAFATGLAQVIEDTDEGEE